MTTWFCVLQMGIEVAWFLYEGEAHAFAYKANTEMLEECQDLGEAACYVIQRGGSQKKTR